MNARPILSFGKFFASAHFFLIIFIIAPYLATFMPASDIGLVISVSAVVSLFMFPYVPFLFGRYGAQRLTILFAILEAFLLLFLALDPAPALAVVLTILACALSPLLSYPLDILLEATVKSEEETGRIRTAFLTAGNTALLLTPLIIGLLLDGGNRYDRVFFVAFLSLIPFIVLMLGTRLPHGRMPLTRTMPEAFLSIMRDRDLRAIVLSMGILQFFYYLAPLYIPLYLHTVLGMSWGELGWVFAIMLIPFVLIEYPAGILADTKYGDRALLLGGFACTGIAFALIALVTANTPILVVLIILLLTRVGAALVEAMTEGHFFRLVSEEDTGTVTIFRMMRPVGALIAPLIGSLFLVVSTYQVFFLSTGLLIAIGGVMAASAVKRFSFHRGSV